MILARQSFRDGTGWLVLSALALLTVGAAYPYAAAGRLAGPSGGSTYGIISGTVGTAMIVFTMLLSGKKKWRTLRVGSAYTWLQGHIWIGLVSYPIICCHAGWKWGGPLTTGLMWLFTFIWVSGVIGLLIQNVVPRLLLYRVTEETVYEQIDRVARENLKAARRLVRGRLAATPSPSTGTTAAAERQRPDDQLLKFYEEKVRPFLASGLDPGPGSWFIPWRRLGALLAGIPRLRPGNPPPPGDFARMRSDFPGLFDEITALESYVEQRKQHLLQKKLHWLLHGWLLVHVPASIALILLLPLHIVLALRY